MRPATVLPASYVMEAVKGPLTIRKNTAGIPD